jgi:hypothetical protein
MLSHTQTMLMSVEIWFILVTLGGSFDTIDFLPLYGEEIYDILMKSHNSFYNLKYIYRQNTTK